MVQNLFTQSQSTTQKDRQILNGHGAFVIWFTGLSGSGKSTLAMAVSSELHKQGVHTYVLDGDNLRQGLNKDLGFSDADRSENIRRVGEVARLMVDAGLVVLTAFISPFQKDRDAVRRLLGSDSFVEVFVDCPLEVCARRDPKGLYKKANSLELLAFTGRDSEYENPTQPDLVIKTSEQEALSCVQQLLTFLKKTKKLS